MTEGKNSTAASPREAGAGLPPYFQRPRPANGAQLTLFPRPLGAVLAELRVSEDELTSWRTEGWISAGADRTLRLEPHQENEIRFVRELLRARLPHALVRRLLDELPRPLTMDPDRVAYSFSFGWVQVMPCAESSEVIAEHLSQWLDDRKEAGDRDYLEGIRDLAEELLEEMPGEK